MKLTITGITLNVECPQLEVLGDKIDKMLREGRKIMGLVEDLDAKVEAIALANTNLNTALDNVRLGMEAIKTELEQLRTGEVLSTVVATKLQSIADKADGVLVIVADTLAENVPATPEEPPAEV